ncbi:hypothetical protein [Brevibacterium luteolum]|uniref:Secreted protein n=1 Tax=Brevibacterium luteolum TaxID=199591 RepID=A0A6G8KYX7_9MICO|nr:hypothetical protein [Brevibacterium luteolum]QIN29831.1 hypothetical protein EW640_11515 [Brevibacterium luteolum]
MRQIVKPRMVQVSTALCAAVLVLSACGGANKEMEEDTGGGADSASSVEQWQHDFTRCMSDEGIELADGGGIPVNADGSFGGSEDSGDFDRALQTCEEKLGPPPQDAGAVGDEELEAQLLRFSKCMREAGYDVPDPDFGSGEGPVISGVPDADPEDVERCSAEAGLEVGAGVEQ